MRCHNVAVISLLVFSIGCAEDAGLASESGTGQGGSMARFAISGNYLYLVDKTNIKVFDITGGKFESLREVVGGWQIETIFATADHLYLGANDGMYIFSIADPANPAFVFRYQHIVSCDPVVVQGNRAYITMRSGTLCPRGANALEILDISDPNNPTVIKNLPMESPHGLSIDQAVLFVCQGEHGISVLDVTDEKDPKFIARRNGFQAYDVIFRNGLATVTGEDGIYQFSYSRDTNEIELVSQIPVLRQDL